MYLAWARTYWARTQGRLVATAILSEARASIIRMLADYLGEKDFRDGLRHYLKKHSYQNTETIHLWQAFEKVSGKSVAKMMHVWTSKPGYPVVRAEMKKGKLTFSQTRFFANPLSSCKYCQN